MGAGEQPKQRFSARCSEKKQGPSNSTDSEISQMDPAESVKYTPVANDFMSSICHSISEIQSQTLAVGTKLRNPYSSGQKLLWRDMTELSRICNKFIQHANLHNSLNKGVIIPPTPVEEQFRHTLYRCLDILEQIEKSIDKYNSKLRQRIAVAGLWKGKEKQRCGDHDAREKCELDFPRFRLEILMASISIYFGLAFFYDNQFIGQEMEKSFLENFASDILFLLRRLDAEDLQNDTRMVFSPVGTDKTITHQVYKRYIHAIIAYIEETQPSSSTGNNIFTAANSDDILKSLGIIKGTVFNYAVLGLLSRYVNLDTHPPPYDTVTNDSAATLVTVSQPHASSKTSLLSRSFSFIKNVLPTSDSAVQLAMNSRNYTQAYKLVSNGGNLDIRDKNGRTLLHIYAASGDTEKLAYLLHNTDSKVDVRDRVGKTPLHHASQQHPKYANISTFKELLDCGADVNAKDNNGFMPLHLVSWKNNIGNIKGEVIDLLLSRAADIYSWDNQGLTPIHTACDEADTMALMALLRAKPHLNVSSGDKLGKTPLHYAAYRRCVSGVLALFNHGSYADPRCVDVNGMTPLHCVFQDLSTFDGEHAEQQTQDIVTALVERGGDVNATDRDGWTPLHYAVKNRSEALVEDFLMVEGVDINAITDRGITPLVVAAEGRGKDMVQLLLEKGAKVSAKAYRASIQGRVLGFDEEIVDMLEKGARFSPDEDDRKDLEKSYF